MHQDLFPRRSGLKITGGMNRIIFLSALFLLFSFCSLSGQNVRISGSGKGYAGAEIRIFTLSDPITKSHRPITRITCDEEGSFSVIVSVKGTVTVFIRAGIYTFYLYATEGKEYFLKLADFIPKPAEEEQNPFFEEVKIMPEIVNDTADINNLIRKFDAEYDPAYNRIADRVAFNTRRSDIPAIIEKLNFLSTPGMPELLRDFIKFRMIMINMVGSGEYSGRVEDSVLINKEFVPGNPAYTDLIEQRFSGYFTSVLNGPYRNDFINAITASSLSGLEKVIQLDGKVANNELGEYIILLNLYPSWYDGSIPAENILKIISAVKSEGCSVYIRELAGVISERVLSLYQGYPAPEFSLKDSGGNVKTLAGFSGKYLLLSFTRSDNASAIAEYGILNSWYKKYSANLQVVTILTDNNFTTASARMKSAGFGWTMLDGSKQDMVEYLYNIRMYPAFILVGPDGKTVISGCPFPSENLERSLAVKFSPGR
jgi:hypothetical protein